MVFALVALAVVANGSVFWLKRIGLLDHENYQAYHAQIEYYKQQDFQRMEKEQKESLVKEAQSHRAQVLARLYELNGWEYSTKLLKDFVFVFIFFASLWIIINANERHALFRVTPVSIYALFLLPLFVASCIKHGLTLPSLGLRPFLFLTLALFAYRVATKEAINWLANWLCVILLLQVLFVSIEAIYAIKTFSGHPAGLPTVDRMVGTLSQPATLAIFSVVVCYLGCQFQIALKSLLFVACCAVLVWLSVSATGTILFVLMLVFVFAQRVRRKYNKLTLVLLSLLVALFLVWTMMSGRLDFFGSIVNRFEKYLIYFATDLSWFEQLFGHGFGVRANIALNIDKIGLANDQLRLYSTDSTPLNLAIQTGWVGCLFFYGMIFAAAWRDTQFRGLYALIVLASLTTVITESFPVNLILGLLLAHSFFHTGAGMAEIDQKDFKNQTNPV